MGKDLYLITYPGERHEDHIPIGVYDFDKLNSLYEVVAFYNLFSEKYIELTEEYISSWDNNTWHEITVVDFDSYDTEDGDCDFIETQNKDGKYDHAMNNVWIIRVNINDEMPGT